jgi:putative ABC transport system substrate-binding protein
MHRRAFLRTVVVVFLAAAFPAQAQQAGKVHRVGYLSFGPPATGQGDLAAFRQRMQELGWAEGRNLAVETRWAEGRRDRLPGLAAELVQLPVDVIVTITTPAAQAAKAATSTIPVVMAGSADPVTLGLIASLARPGGNVTGVTHSPGIDFFGKQVQLLKEAVPRISRVGVLMHPGIEPEMLSFQAGQRSAPELGVTLIQVAVTDAAFDVTALTRARADALFIFPNSPNWTNRVAIAKFASENRLPTMWPEGKEALAETGGLLSYMTDWLELRRRAALFVDKILRGARPADLPVEQPTKFELVVNLRTAKALALTVPPSVLVRADEIIE